MWQSLEGGRDTIAAAASGRQVELGEGRSRPRGGEGRAAPGVGTEEGAAAPAGLWAGGAAGRRPGAAGGVTSPSCGAISRRENTPVGE